MIICLTYVFAIMPCQRTIFNLKGEIVNKGGRQLRLFIPSELCYTYSVGRKTRRICSCFLNILQTILLLIASGVAYLVYRSSRGTRNTRKSLHSRRRDIYGDLVRILTTLSKTGEIRKVELLDFRSRTLDAALIFDTEIAAYIDEIYTRGVKLMSTSELLKGADLPIGEKRDDITVENARQTIWLADQLAMVEKKFGHYPEVK